jgi:hypothetical protein
LVVPNVEGATKINFVPLGNRLWLSSGLLCVADLVKMQAAEDDAAPARREERKDAAPHSKHFALPCIFLFVAQKCPFFLARDRNECPPQKGENCQLHKNKIKENKYFRQKTENVGISVAERQNSRRSKPANMPLFLRVFLAKQSLFRHSPSVALVLRRAARSLRERTDQESKHCLQRLNSICRAKKKR